LCATPRCVQRCRQGPLLGTARMPVQTLSSSLRLPWCVWSSFS
jgi:hypothetical protein